MKEAGGSGAGGLLGGSRAGGLVGAAGAQCRSCRVRGMGRAGFTPSWRRGWRIYI